MIDELNGILAGLDLKAPTIEDCLQYMDGKLDREQIRDLPKIEMHKTPQALQDRIRSLYLRLLREDKTANEKFLRLFHLIGGITLFYVLYRHGEGFRDEFDELSRHAFLHLDMLRWLGFLGSTCQIHYIRPYAALFFDRIYRESPQLILDAANQSAPMGQLYLVTIVFARDPQNAKLKEWFDKAIVVLSSKPLFEKCALNDNEIDMIIRFLSGDDAVSTEKLEEVLTPEVKIRISGNIDTAILNGLYYCCSMAEGHTKVAKMFLRLIALIDFSLSLECSGIISGVKGNYGMQDRHIYSVHGDKPVIVDADYDSFEILGAYFARDKSSAYMLAKKLDGSDPGTFVVLGQFNSQFARDKSSVYWNSRRIEGADPKTFKVLGGYHCYWAKDANKAYCFYGDNAAPKIINTKDPKKFELVKESYWIEHARDEKYVYYYGRRVKNADPTSFRRLPCERFGEEDNKNDYYTDGARIYHKGDEVIGADVDSFLAYWLPGLGNSQYGVDQNNAYYDGKPLPPVDAIEVMKTARRHPQFAEKIGEDAIRRMEEWDRTGKRPDGTAAAAGNIDFARFNVEILEWGEYQVDRRESRTGKTVNVLNKFVLKRRSSLIPAVQGVTFGIDHTTTGTTSPAINNLTIRLLHPPIRDPATGITTDKNEWDIPVGLDTKSHNSHSFDEDWEIAEGRWVFQVIHGETVLAEKAFEVRKPPVAPEMPVVETEHAYGQTIISTAVSPDGRFAVSGGTDATIKLWGLEKSNLLRTFKGHTDCVDALAFSPDGKRFLSGSTDRSVKLWDLESGKEIRTFSGHENDVHAVAFSSDGRYALSGSEDETIRLREIESGKEVKIFKRHMAVYAVAFTPDRRSILSAGLHMKLWDLESGKLIRNIKFKRSGTMNVITSIAFTRDGKQVLTGNMDQTLKLYDIETGTVVKTFPGHTNLVTSIDISPDGMIALSGSADMTVKLWDLESTEEIRTFSGHTAGVNSVHFLPDGKTALSGGIDGTIRLWDVETGEEKARLSDPMKGGSNEQHGQ